MRHSTRTLAITLALLSTLSHADDYKCYVQATDGRKHIVFAEADTLATAQMMMQSARVAAKKKGEVGLEHIIECTSADQPFRSSEARALESSTPM